MMRTIADSLPTRFADFFLRMPPHASHGHVDVAIGVVTLAMIPLAGWPAIAASCASFLYFLIMIGKEIARWWARRRVLPLKD